MTINLANNDPRVSYTVAEGVTQTSFTVPFEFFANADLNVYVDGTLKTLTTHYTVTGGDGSTGTVTISVTGASGGSTVVITRTIDLERTTDFPTSGPFDVNSLNTELDKQVAMIADLKDKTDRALQLTDFDTDVSLVLPDVDTRKGKTLAFNATSGAVEAGPSIADVQTVSAASADIASLADIEDGTTATDAISGLAAIKANVTTVAGIASNVTTVAGQTTNLANVTANLSAIQNAATNATNAATSATNAETAKTAAEAAQAAAETALDNFDDTYLGAKSSDPTVDNDGDALSAGDLYFNTTSDELKYYTGSAWVAINSGIASLAADTTPQLGGNLDVVTHSIVSTSNRSITLTPNGTGDVLLQADTVQVGDNNANATVTTQGTGDLILNTNSGTNSGNITILDGANGNITVTPNGTGNVALGNFTFNADQTVGASQDNFLMTYDNSAGTIGLEAAPAGGAGFFQGDNGNTGDTTNGKKDIFRVHEAQLDTNTTIAAGENAGCFFSLTVASGVTLTLNGNLVIA